MEPQWYVYQLSDPRTGVVFYVGKGKGRRAWSHEASARNGRHERNYAKYGHIRSILDAGERVVVTIVARFDDERHALNAESTLIRTTPGLDNIAPYGVPQGAQAICAVLAADWRARIARVRTFEQWQRAYPHRHPDIYWDVYKSHHELAAWLEERAANG